MTIQFCVEVCRGAGLPLAAVAVTIRLFDLLWLFQIAMMEIIGLDKIQKLKLSHVRYNEKILL